MEPITVWENTDTAEDVAYEDIEVIKEAEDE